MSLSEVVKEYKFSKGDLGYSGWMSLVLTAVARAAIEGPTPMFVTEAQNPAAGKSMFLDLASIIANGECVEMMARSTSEENQKLIVSTVRKGSTWLAFDNEKQGCVFACPVIASTLTKHYIGGRNLGVSEIVKAPNRLLICTSGNQLSFSKEIARRTLLIEIDHQPGHTFKKADLRRWVRENRVRLLRDALIVLRYGLSQPRAERKPLESYETWSSMVRDTIITMLMPDPIGLVHAAQQKDADEESDRSLIEATIDLIHSAQDAVTAISVEEPKTLYLGATAIGQQAMTAIKQFERSGNPNHHSSLYMSAQILAARCQRMNRQGIESLDPVTIGRRLGPLLGIVVDGRQLVRGGKHNQYRVEDENGNAV